LLLAFALSLDSFRASVGLGALRPRARVALRLAATFALVEAGAPLVGIALGGALVPLAGPWTLAAGPVMLAGTGVYVLVDALRDGQSAQRALGVGTSMVLPLSLGLDNLVAGGGLGLMGMPPLLAAAVIGAISGLLALAGLWLGAAVSTHVPERSEVISGVFLLGAAGLAAAA
jgi:putative Mn2+ efflux pump MntP